MNINRKGFSNLILIGIIIAVAAGVLGYVIWRQGALFSTQTPPSSKESQQETGQKSLQTNLFGKLPQFKIVDFQIGAGGSGISIWPTSFIFNITSKPTLPNSASVYMYKTNFSSQYVAETAKRFGMPLLEKKTCPADLDCGVIENGVAKVNVSGAGQSWLISYGPNSTSQFKMLQMTPDGTITLSFNPDKNSPLFSLPQAKDAATAISLAEKWLYQYYEVFGDLEGVKVEYQGSLPGSNPLYPNVIVTYYPPGVISTIYRGLYIRVSASVLPTTNGSETTAVISWISATDPQSFIYGLRSLDDAEQDIKFGRGVIVHDWPLSEAKASTDENGNIKGAFTATEVSLAYGRIDDIPFSRIFLEPVYVFSGILDTGKQKLPLKIWTPAIPQDKG